MSVLKPPLLGLALIVFMVCEKFLAHTYTVLTIYVLPAPWKYWIPALVGMLGVVLIILGLSRDQVRASLLGYLGAVLIWMSWFESGLPLLSQYNEIKTFLPSQGNMMAGLLGEHVLLQASGIFCIMLLILMLLNKDVRCRMLIWLRKRLGLRDSVGVPASASQVKVSRVAATEYLFVTWFMYVVTLIIVDPRIFGLYHPVTYLLSFAISIWAFYLLYKLTQQKEPGYAIRYAIAAVGVAWFIPEMLALYELFYEFYIYADKHPWAISAVLITYLLMLRVLWKIPGQSSGSPNRLSPSSN